MNFFKTQQNPHAPLHIIVVEISTESQREEGWVSRNDFNSFEQAEEVAEAASRFEGVDYIAIDNGQYCSPRYDVIKAPQQLDPVSYCFNGDYYPCGYIKTISKTMKKITTTTGKTFYRRFNTGNWVSHGVWSMVKGHIEAQNPHF